MTATVHAAVIPAQPAAPTAEALASWEIVQRAQAGAGSACAELYQRSHRTFFRYVYFRVGQHHLAEDLTQETYLKALRNIGSFTWQGTDINAWLITIARNLVTDHFKSGHYQRSRPVGCVFQYDELDDSTEGDPEGAVIAHFTHMRLLRRLSHLTPDQRQVIELRFLRGLPVRATAEAMGRNEGAVKALQYRAVQSLARLYDIDQENDL